MTTKINNHLSDFTATVLSTYLRMPEGKPITVLDWRCEDGSFAARLTKNAHEKYLYGADDRVLQVEKARKHFHKVCYSHYRSTTKITNNVFSIVIANPTIDDRFIDDIFSTYDPFQIPDFEEEERKRLEALEQQKDELIDFGDEGLTEEEIQKRKEKFQKKLQEAVEKRQIAFRRAILEQERRTAGLRSDKELLSNSIKILQPGGILIFITPKEFIDSQICYQLANNFDDIRIYRLDDLEYEEYRKCIILARKRPRAERRVDYAFELMQTKYKRFKELPVLDIQAAPLYDVPSGSNEDIHHFRVGPITPEEVLDAVRKSPLIERYSKTTSQILDDLKPKPPTQLHKGHIALMLASGHLNGYIGKGIDQHLVKGTVKKMVNEFLETDPTTGERVRREREYYKIAIKYLDRNGEFHTLL